MTTGHDGERRPSGYSSVVAVLGGLAYGLIQVALLLAGLAGIVVAAVAGRLFWLSATIVLAAAWIVCAAKWGIKGCTPAFFVALGLVGLWLVFEGGMAVGAWLGRADDPHGRAEAEALADAILRQRRGP